MGRKLLLFWIPCFLVIIAILLLVYRNYPGKRVVNHVARDMGNVVLLASLYRYDYPSQYYYFILYDDNSLEAVYGHQGGAELWEEGYLDKVSKQQTILLNEHEVNNLNNLLAHLDEIPAYDSKEFGINHIEARLWYSDKQYRLGYIIPYDDEPDNMNVVRDTMQIIITNSPIPVDIAGLD